MYVLMFLLESTANNEQSDFKKVKIGIEFIDLYNFLALSTNFGHIQQKNTLHILKLKVIIYEMNCRSWIPFPHHNTHTRQITL